MALIGVLILFILGFIFILNGGLKDFKEYKGKNLLYILFGGGLMLLAVYVAQYNGYITG